MRNNAFQYISMMLLGGLTLGLWILAGCSASMPAQTPTPAPASVTAAMVTSLPSPTPAPPTPTPTSTPAPSATPTPTTTPTPSNTPTPTRIPPTPDPAAPPGRVTGAICYPGAITPPMTVYVENLAGGVVELPVEVGQTTYAAEGLPPGDYVAYAHTNGARLEGAYTQAIPCGQTAACTDHSLLPFEVVGGATTAQIDLCDWDTRPGIVRTTDELTGITTLQAMNVFSGPGLAFPSVGLAPPRYSAPALARNHSGSWLQIEYPLSDAAEAWIYSPLVRITGNPETLPLAAGARLTPRSAADQFSPVRWSFTYNQEIIHFKGYIRDERRNPINGFSILADNGTWSVLSHPTGASRHYPDLADGEWDIVIFKPFDAIGWWTLTVVRYDCPGFDQGFNAQCKDFTRLSEDRVVKVIYPDQSVINADWVCHRDCGQGLYVRGYRP